MAQMHIMDIGKNVATGLITMEARILDPADPVNGVGAIERFHVEALDIANNYGGDVGQWLQHKGREMWVRHKQRTAAHNDLHKWQGQSMNILGIQP